MAPAAMDFVKAIKELPAKQRWKAVLASGLIMWAAVLTVRAVDRFATSCSAMHTNNVSCNAVHTMQVDMHYLKQREDFQQRFGTPKPVEDEQDVPEWKRARREREAAATAAAEQ